jgi:hypothetical protein
MIDDKKNFSELAMSEASFLNVDESRSPDGLGLDYNAKKHMQKEIRACLSLLLVLSVGFAGNQCIHGKISDTLISVERTTKSRKLEETIPGSCSGEASACAELYSPNACQDVGRSSIICDAVLCILQLNCDPK